MSETRKLLFTPQSVKDLVVCVSHLLDHFADSDHQGLSEAQNKPRRMPDTGVLIHPRFGGDPNRIGFRFFVANPTDRARDQCVAVAFDLESYEKYGDRYLFNMLNGIREHIKLETRPSAEMLKEMSTRYALTN